MVQLEVTLGVGLPLYTTELAMPLNGSNENKGRHDRAAVRGAPGGEARRDKRRDIPPFLSARFLQKLIGILSARARSHNRFLWAGAVHRLINYVVGLKHALPAPIVRSIQTSSASAPLVERCVEAGFDVEACMLASLQFEALFSVSYTFCRWHTSKYLLSTTSSSTESVLSSS